MYISGIQVIKLPLDQCDHISRQISLLQLPVLFMIQFLSVVQGKNLIQYLAQNLAVYRLQQVIRAVILYCLLCKTKFRISAQYNKIAI